jgi:hypothetical protein
MTASEFERKLKKLARRRGLTYVVTNAGKGDHRRIQLGDRRTTLGDSGNSELGRGIFHAMCKQLGIEPSDL